MKKINAIIGTLVILMAPMTFANTVITPTPISTVLLTLKSENYSSFRDIKLNGNTYKAYALNPQGSYTKLIIDAKTGEIISPKSAAPMLSMLDVAEKVEGAGYNSVSEIEAKGSSYIVTAVNPQGESVSLKVDSKTGVISQ